MQTFAKKRSCQFLVLLKSSSGEGTFLPKSHRDNLIHSNTSLSSSPGLVSNHQFVTSFGTISSRLVWSGLVAEIMLNFQHLSNICPILDISWWLTWLKLTFLPQYVIRQSFLSRLWDRTLVSVWKSAINPTSIIIAPVHSWEWSPNFTYWQINSDKAVNFTW